MSIKKVIKKAVKTTVDKFTPILDKPFNERAQLFTDRCNELQKEYGIALTPMISLRDTEVKETPSEGASAINQ